MPVASDAKSKKWCSELAQRKWFQRGLVTLCIRVRLLRGIVEFCYIRTINCCPLTVVHAVDFVLYPKGMTTGQWWAGRVRVLCMSIKSNKYVHKSDLIYISVCLSVDLLISGLILKIIHSSILYTSYPLEVPNPSWMWVRGRIHCAITYSNNPLKQSRLFNQITHHGTINFQCESYFNNVCSQCVLNHMKSVFGAMVHNINTIIFSRSLRS